MVQVLHTSRRCPNKRTPTKTICGRGDSYNLSAVVDPVSAAALTVQRAQVLYAAGGGLEKGIGSAAYRISLTSDLLCSINSAGGTVITSECPQVPHTARLSP